MKILHATLAAVLLCSAGLAQEIDPCVDAIELTAPGHYRFWFGYRSTFSINVALTTGMTDGVAHSAPPTIFMPGRAYAVFWSDGDSMWKVGNKTATASMGFQSLHPREFLDNERPFVPGAVIWFDFRPIVENGENKYIFRWWRRDKVTGKIPNELAWQDGDWTKTPRPESVTYTLVLTGVDLTAARTRLGLGQSEPNDRRALINEALRQIDTLTSTP